jgi:hypothetical protein
METEVNLFLVKRDDGTFLGLSADMSTVWMDCEQGAVNYLERKDAESAVQSLSGLGIVSEVVEAGITVDPL